MRIIKVIVSNSFQGDNIFINETYLKVSIFELTVILKNDLYNVLMSKMGSLLFDDKFDMPVSFLNNIINKNNPNIKTENNTITLENTNLWKDRTSCHPNNIVNAIKNNSVFKHLSKNKKYNRESTTLTKFKPNHKYLS